MADELPYRRLEPEFNLATDTRVMLDHARQQTEALGLADYFVVDVDSHREPEISWREVIDYIENPVMRSNAVHDFETYGRQTYLGTAGATGYMTQAMHGRIPHMEPQREPVPTSDVHRDVVLCRRAMDAMGIDLQVVFPTSLLALGMAPVAAGEAQLGYAYNRWMLDRFCVEDTRLKFMPFLPMKDPDMCLRIVRESAANPSVVGFLVTSVRHDPVNANKYMRLYAEIEETGLPLTFHAGPTWDDDWMKTMNKFISVHAISFVHCNVVHMTNWIMNGLPERFPNLKVIWMESGLAWIPWLMQRLDHEYMKRTSEAPMLTRLPSEYMRDMYYSSQPMEVDHPEMLEATMRALNAETQLLYASDWPHWDFDLPSSILDQSFLSDSAKRNILGLNAARVMNLEVPGVVAGASATAGDPARNERTGVTR
jgi:hypothetical protein